VEVKKKYIDGTYIDPNWLRDYSSQLKYIKEPYEGILSYMHIHQVTHPVPVDYDQSNTTLVDNDYKVLMFLPKDHLWCVSVFYKPNHQVVEWYFDMTKENGLDLDKPYFMDLFLDLAISPRGQVSVLDEDELDQAKNEGVIDQADVDLAYKTCQDLQDKWIQDDSFMIDFFRDHLNLFTE